MNHGTRSLIALDRIRADRFSQMYEADPQTGCWNWKHSVNGKGYGQFSVDGKVKQAHRVSYVLHYGAQPDVVMHDCDNPACVNPEHLRNGNNFTNMQDALRKGRRSRPKGMRSLFELVALAQREFDAIAA